MSDRLLRTRDVADILDVSVETVLRWHRSGKLPGGHRLASNVLRFRESELEAWLHGVREASGGAEEVAPIHFPSPDAGRSLAVAPIHDNRGGSDDAC
jgi:excisionase family DNA binding protein